MKVRNVSKMVHSSQLTMPVQFTTSVASEFKGLSSAFADRFLFRFPFDLLLLTNLFLDLAKSEQAFFNPVGSDDTCKSHEANAVLTQLCDFPRNLFFFN